MSINVITLDRKRPLMSESSNSRATIVPEMTPIPAPLQNPVSVVCPFMAPAMPPTITPPTQIKYRI